ncbi:hypothetical protein Tco_1168515 [Tanacetum coccineum]
MKILSMSPSNRTAVGMDVEYRKASLASLDVSALDKPHFKLKNMLRRFIHESNPDDTDNGVTTSYQQCQTYYHMLILKLQRHTVSIKVSRNQESSKSIKTKTFLNIQKTIGISREIVSFQDDAKYEHVGPKHKAIQGCSRIESVGLFQKTTKVSVTTIKII